MTDKEIIKALECFAIDNDFDVSQCVGCAFESKSICCENASEGIAKASLDLINRLQAEKEALIAGQETMSKYIEEQQAEIEKLVKLLDDKCDRCIAKERTEAVKEFANELKRVFAGHSDYHGDTILTKIVCLAEGKVIKCAEPIDTNNMKAKAVKRFAERLKEKLDCDVHTSEGFYFMVSDTIDNLVKEMVGDAE